MAPALDAQEPGFSLGRITADTALRLGRYVGTDALFWINLQVAHDLSKAEAQTDNSRTPTRAA
jgi:plasmid maintenance system antidote protein VapI